MLHRVSDATAAEILSVLVAALIVLTSTAGLVFGTRGLYTPDPSTLPTFLGQDALSLLVGLPLLVASMLLAHRGSLRAQLVWLGVLFYFAYSYSYYVLDPQFNGLYLAYIAIVSMSLYGLIYLLLTTDSATVKARFDPHTPVHLVGGFMIFMALLLAFKWVGAILADLNTGAPPPHKEAVVWPLDLVIALPALCWGGVWLWRRKALGYLTAGLLLLKAAFVGITLVVDSYLVTLWGEPLDPMLPAYAVIGLGGLALLVVYLRALKPAGAVKTFPPGRALSQAQSTA